MADTLQTFYDTQVTGEIKTYSTNFGDFLGSGASIPSGSLAATYQQTFGGAASGSCAVSVTGGSIANHTSPALSLTGTYTFAVTANMSDGQTRKAIWYVRVDK